MLLDHPGGVNSYSSAIGSFSDYYPILEKLFLDLANKRYDTPYIMPHRNVSFINLPSFSRNFRSSIFSAIIKSRDFQMSTEFFGKTKYVLSKCFFPNKDLCNLKGLQI